MCCSGSGTMRRRRAVLTFRGWKSPAWSSPAMRRRWPRPASGSAIASARCWPAGGMRRGAGGRAGHARRGPQGRAVCGGGGAGIQGGGAFGATVIATAGSEEKCAACLALGAQHAIDYKTQDFVAEIKRITAGRGVDVVLDMVAGDYVAREVECLAEDGRLVIIAVQGGVKSSLNAGLVLRRRLTITGSTLRPRPVAFKAAIAQALRHNVWPLLAAGTLRPVVHSQFAAADASQAHALMESNRHIGKIVLTWP